MSELEKPPAGWWWNPDVSPSQLDQMLADNKGRLVSLSVRSTNPQRLAAVWIAKGADDDGAGWNHDIDAAALGQLLANKKARLTCLTPFVSNGAVRFAAAWIPNQGANAAAWWWNPDVDPPALGQMLANNKARLTTLSSYVLDGKRHHAAVWIDNTGPNAVAWWWNPDVDAATLGTMLDNNKGRLVCLDTYIENGALRFGAAWIENTGTHAKGWHWYHGLGPDTIGFKLDQFCEFLAELKTYPSGNGIHLGCVMYGFPQKAVDAANLLSITGTGTLASNFKDMAPLGQNDDLSVTVKNITASPVKLTAGNVQINESGGFVDWSGSIYGNGGLFGPSPITLAPGQVKAVGPQNFPWGAGAANFVLDLQAESGGSKEHTHVVVPIMKAGAAAPAPLSAPHPVYIGLWTSPAEIFPLWTSKEELWISIAGQMVNTSGSTVRLAAWHAKLVIDGQTILDKDLALNFWDTNAVNKAPIGADGAAYLPDVLNFFAQGFTLPGVSKSFQSGHLTITANYKIGGVCGATVHQSAVKFFPPVTIASPVQGLSKNRFWNFGNGPNHNGYDAHEWPQERYAYDITMVDETGKTHDLTDDASMQLNKNFYAYGQPVFAVKGGIVDGADDTQPENSGNKAMPVPKPNNFVLIKHDDGTYAGYYHLQTGKNKVVPGQMVAAGAQIGEIGNAGGSSEPHLHFAYTTVDPTGRGTITPAIFSGLKSKANVAVTAVPATGQYIA
jgi:murein DD-endopeptidase MepM/ murein hydrolase activator NlpD